MNPLPKMNPRLLPCLIALAFAFCGPNATAQTATDLNEGSRLTRDPATGVSQFSWFGQSGRTYFLQQSENLANWTYLPMIESGANQIIRWGMSSSAQRSFLRLRYSDLPTNNPFDADFDHDGVGNYDELLLGTDPLSWHDGDGTHSPNGLPDDWELYRFGVVGVDPSADQDNDGVTNLQEYQLRTDPNDPNSGPTPSLAIVDGNYQWGPPGDFVPAPLQVSVFNATRGWPLPGVAVTFTILQGAGSLQKSSSAPAGSSLTVVSDSSGVAKAFFKLPPAANSTNRITAAASNGAQLPEPFYATSDTGGNPYNSPFAPGNVTATLNRDGSVDVSWTNNTDDAGDIPIQLRMPDGSWAVVKRVPAGTTSYRIPPNATPVSP